MIGIVERKVLKGCTSADLEVVLTSREAYAAARIAQAEEKAIGFATDPENPSIKAAANSVALSTDVHNDPGWVGAPVGKGGQLLEVSVAALR